MGTSNRTKTEPGAGDLEEAAKVSPEQRRQYVEVAAYYLAERDGFKSGAEMDHWLCAEAEVDQLLADRHND